MDAQWLSTIRNKSLTEKLLSRDAISHLEELLDVQSQTLMRLQSLKESGKLKRGDKLPAAQVKALLPPVFSEVKDFLGAQDARIPPAGYSNLFKMGLTTTPLLVAYGLSGFLTAVPLVSFAMGVTLDENYALYIGVAGATDLLLTRRVHSIISNRSEYNYLSGEIILQQLPRTSLIPVAAHEYAHSVEFGMGFNRSYSVFQEGHARGVERYMAECYRVQEDNEAFLYDVSQRTVGEFKRVYWWMCRKLGQQPRKSLLGAKTNTDHLADVLLTGEPSPHALGNVIFSLCEAQQGKEVYKLALQGNLKRL